MFIKFNILCVAILSLCVTLATIKLRRNFAIP